MKKIRPFERQFERGEGVPVFIVSGRIEGDVYVLDLAGQRVPLSTASVSEDKWGPFADVPVRDHFKSAELTVSVDHGDDDLAEGESGARIDLSYGADRIFSLYFDATGTTDGGGGPGGPLRRSKPN